MPQADHAELSTRKAQARALAQERRAAAHEQAETGQGATRLRELLSRYSGRILSGYMPMRTEIDPLPAMAAHDGPVCVPVIAGPGQPLRFREWSCEAEMVPGPFGARVPAAGAWLEPEILIVPLLAFDRRGYRLGYGGGYYDRTLAALHARGAPVAIGFAYSAQEVGEVPVGAFDQPLDMIVTEAEVIAPLTR